MTGDTSICREVIANKSKAAAGLCDWAINIVKYFDVVAEVEPKRAELAAANGKLNDANATLKTVQDKVAGLNAQVRSLEEAYSKVSGKMQSPLPSPTTETVCKSVVTAKRFRYSRREAGKFSKQDRSQA